MINLFLRSTIVLALLFGLLFAVGMAAVIFFELPSYVALIFALVILLLQYIFGPTIIQLIYKIEWREAKSVDPDLASFIDQTAAKRGFPSPRFGVIRDGNPNAFTFGHYPGNARLVVTTGLLELLDTQERKAVVAHELGHIAHWDFVVMTIAAAVPLLLYVIYITTRSGRSRRGKSGEYIALIAFVSYIAYLVSHYIVLLLSRVREYYADQFAGEATNNPNALSTALVKIAYGLARAPKAEGEKDDSRMVAARAFGIFDPKTAQTLALASAGGGKVTAASMQSAMKWDLWNPWAWFYELVSTHPLPAKRIRALERQSDAYNQVPLIRFQMQRPESYWDEFLVDLLINYLPLLAFFAGTLLALAFGVMVGFGLHQVGLVLLLVSAAWWLKRRFSYRHEFTETRNVQSLIDEVKVSQVRSIPCRLSGKIIGRGVPGLFYSDDLVLQDGTGFIIMDYRQPIRFLEFLFGWFKAEQLVGASGEALGWYRRAPRPYFEMRELRLESGETVTSYLYPVSQFFVYAGMVLGVILLFFAL